MTTAEAFKTSVAKTAASIERLANLVSPQHWFPMDEDEKESRYYFNKKRRSQHQALKEKSKKARKAKLDPSNAMNVTQTLHARHQQEMEAREARLAQQAEVQDADEDAEDDGDDDEEEDDGDDDEEEEEDDEDDEEEDEESSEPQLQPSLPKEELRAKFANKLQELQDNRTSKKTYRPEKTVRKQDKKARRKAQKAKAAVEASKAQAKAERSALPDAALRKSRPASSTTTGKADVSENVSFGNVEFGGMKKKKKGPSNNDVRTQLKMAEAKKEKMQELMTKDPAKASEVKEKQSWGKAMAQIAGTKVKDDVRLLKKSVKRLEKRKEQSKKQWGDRKKQVATEMKQRQKKRTDNIAAKAASIKEKKIQKRTGKKPKPTVGKKKGGPRK
ncbi:hypothetical protein RI367_000893 [Sorochytrium milnesiophthora]